MPTFRALVLAAIPALLVFLIFWVWLGVAPQLAAAVGLLWGVICLILTRVIYDDHSAEIAAWRAAAPDLADPPGE